MSFGLQPILQRLPTATDIPNVDYKLSKAEVYQQLTKQLLSKTNTLDILSLAAQEHCEGAPSWVPDYSQTLTDLRFGLVYRAFMGNLYHPKATPGSAINVRFDPDNTGVLIVKGFIVEHYAVSIYAPEPLTIQIGNKSRIWHQAPSYRGIYFDVEFGDKMALIAGVSIPLIVRDDGDFVKIVAPAIPEDEGLGGRSLKSLMKGHVWENYDKDRKKKWIEAHGSGSNSGRSSEPDPADYLEDLFIS
ncbi:hypothetical protein N0V90_005403 [Kalmusia sp. IMI 367209]|nr:hypothetical protein N0V90_005403 [Kalmusia sp. IMI 367209]